MLKQALFVTLTDFARTGGEAVLHSNTVHIDWYVADATNVASTVV